MLNSFCKNCNCAALVDNPVAVRVLGVCPLLAVSSTVLKATAMALIFMSALLLSAGIASLTRNLVTWRLRLLYELLIASLVVACASVVFYLANPPLFAALGVYPSLLAVNCYVLANIQGFAGREPFHRALIDGLSVGASVAVWLVAFGVCRELLAYGSLGTDIDLVRGIYGIRPRPPAGPLPVMASAPGALLLFGLFLALRQYFANRAAGVERSLFKRAG